MATTSSNIVTNGSTTFEEGEDFIPFAVLDPSDDKPGPSRRRRADRTNERERETEKNSDRDDATGRERQAISNRELNEVPTSDHVEGKSKMPVSEREWDRGKEVVADDKYDRRNGHGGRNRKRKHEEHDDGYSNQRQRVDVLGSRKCPWVADLDLYRCTNVAEM